MFARTLSFLAVAVMVSAPAVQAQHRGGGFHQTMPSNGGAGRAPAPVQAAPRSMPPQTPAFRPNAPAANYGRPQQMVPQGRPAPTATRPQQIAPQGRPMPQQAMTSGLTRRGPDHRAPGQNPGIDGRSPRSARPAVVAPGSTVNNYTTINRTVNNYYNGGSGYGYNYGYPAWSGNGWGGWGWGWRGGCPGCWYAGAGLGVGFIGGYVVGTVLAQPQPVYVMPVAPTGAVLPSSAAPQMEPVQAYSSSPAWVDRKTGLTCADRTVQRPDRNGGQYLYTAKFCMVEGVWQEYSFAP